MPENNPNLPAPRESNFVTPEEFLDAQQRIAQEKEQARAKEREQSHMPDYALRDSEKAQEVTTKILRPSFGTKNQETGVEVGLPADQSDLNIEKLSTASTPQEAVRRLNEVLRSGLPSEKTKDGLKGGVYDAATKDLADALERRDQAA